MRILYFVLLYLLLIHIVYIIVLVVYDFFALLAFEQIMGLVRSKRYQQLYGSDPFNPRRNANSVKYPNSINVIFNADKYVPKWWELNGRKPISDDENIASAYADAHKYFQNRELMSDVLLHNVINRF